jgi:hypothetical protein
MVTAVKQTVNKQIKMRYAHEDQHVVVEQMVVSHANKRYASVHHNAGLMPPETPQNELQ